MYATLTRCTGFLFILLLLAPVVANAIGEGSRQGTEAYQQRQELFLREALRTPGITSRFDAELHVLLGESILVANAEIVSSTWRPATLIESTRILRLLLQANDPKILPPASRIHLEGEWQATLDRMSERFFGDVDGFFFPEHFDLFSHAIPLLWADYAAHQELNANWPDDSTHLERIELHSAALKEWLEPRVRFGLLERGSAYTSHILVGLLLLHDFCRQPEIAQMATALLDQIVADFSIYRIGSSWGGARIRSMESLGQFSVPGVFTVLFDHPVLLDERIMHNPVSVHLAASTYQPPAALLQLGNSPDERGIFIEKNRYSKGSDPQNRDGQGRRYSFISPHFVLSSFQLRNEAVPWQSRPWDLLVRGEDGNAHRLFPFAGRQLFSGGRPPYEGEYYQWNADVFQHNNVLLFRFLRNDRKREDREPSDPLERRYVQWPTRIWYSDGFQPVSEQDGWWFCQHDDVYIALRPLEGSAYWWRTVKTTTTGTPDASILAMQNLTTSVLIEVDHANRFRSFEGFQQQIISAPLSVEPTMITYVSRRGDVLFFPLDGSQMMVNGRPVDPWSDPEYQLFSNPFMKAPYGAGRMQATWSPFSLNLQWREGEGVLRELLP